MDTCVHAVEWKLDDNTTRIQTKNPSKNKDEDGIFIPAKCKAQNVTLTYIFKDDSSFHIEDPTLKRSIQAFTENKECQMQLKTGSVAIVAAVVAGASTFAMLTVLVSICLFVRHKRRNLMKVDVNTGVYGTYYEGGVEYSTVEVSSKIYTMYMILLIIEISADLNIFHQDTNPYYAS